MPGSAIIYVRNRRRTKEITELLINEEITADFYHAGLDDATKDIRQHRWQTGESRVMVATNAFGMGIDKPDVRIVTTSICRTLPKLISKKRNVQDVTATKRMP